MTEATLGGYRASHVLLLMSVVSVFVCLWVGIGFIRLCTLAIALEVSTSASNTQKRPPLSLIYKAIMKAQITASFQKSACHSGNKAGRLKDINMILTRAHEKIKNRSRERRWG